MPNGSRIEHFCDIIPNAQNWLVLNLPVFMFVYIHLNVPPTRITHLARNVSDKNIYWYETVTFVYVFAFINLVCVQSVNYTANEYFIYHFWRVNVSSQLNSLFILHISTAKPFRLLVRGYIEVKINKHEIWWALTQLTLRCLKYIKGIFNPYTVWHSYFLIPRQSFYEKRAKSLEKTFFQLWKRSLVDFIEISENRCANTNIHWRKLKHPT